MVDNGYECVVAKVEIKNKLTGKALCVYEKLMRSTIYKLEPEIFFKNIVTDGNLPPLGYFEKKGNDYIISLNKDLLDNRAPLEVARTILHESVHALLRYHYVNATNSFVDLFGEYMKEKKGSNDITHAIMRDNYIPAIANALKQFDNNRENPSFYESLAWDGLHQFLSQEEKDKIVNIKIKIRNQGLNCN